MTLPRGEKYNAQAGPIQHFTDLTHYRPRPPSLKQYLIMRNTQTVLSQTDETANDMYILWSNYVVRGLVLTFSCAEQTDAVAH